MTQTLSKINMILVAIVAAIAFILSYNALQNVAAAYGVSGSVPVPYFIDVQLSLLWPLLIDFGLLVFAVAVVRATLLNESTLWPRCLEWLFIVATLVFNIIHSDVHPVSYAVAIMPPVAFVLSFETLMRMLKSGVLRSEWTNSLGDLDKQIKERQAELDKLTRTIETSQTSLTDITGQVEEKKRKARDIGQPIVVIAGVSDPTSLKGQPDKRRVLVKDLINGGIEDQWIIKTFDKIKVIA